MAPDQGSGVRSGGRAGAWGYVFQDKYVAWQLAKLLTGHKPDPAAEVLWEKKVLDPGGGKVQTVAVDDVIVKHESGRWRFIQVIASTNWQRRRYSRTGSEQWRSPRMPEQASNSSGVIRK